MPTSLDILAAKNDPHLQARLVVLAESLGVPNAEHQVQTLIGQLVTVPVASTTCVADVLAYAIQQYAMTPEPGADLTKVTDEHLLTAIRMVLPVPTPTTDPETTI